MSFAGSIPHSLTSSAFICASRFCSTTNTRSCAPMNSPTASANGNAQTRIWSRWMPSSSSAASDSAIAALVDPNQTTALFVGLAALRITGAGTSDFAVSNLRSSRCMLST